ncbi:MAG: peptide chain release factor 1 [Candidatus Aminicenantes bacterium]|nr:peptide chain release factor 1 [Candidatus Aminicenantes bacterium]
MIPDLESVEERHRRLVRSLSDPAVIADAKRFREVSKERAEIEPLIRKHEELKRVRADIAGSREILDDERTEAELKSLASAELLRLEEREAELTGEIRLLLVPKDPLDERSVVLEIRAGAGGDESSLFAQDLFRMYSRYAEQKGWAFETLETSYSPIGGFKEVIAGIRGAGAYSRLKFESGVHRVQRIPKTEAGGRIHTSTVTVAVLPEADEVDVRLDPKDLKIEAFGSSGPGGQSVNRNYTAIRVTHKPSGMIVSCQDEKSQHRNKEKALRVLRSRLLDIARTEQHQKIARDRRTQVGTGERSEKIRTYNFPQSRITDHRLEENFHNLGAILDGALDPILEQLVRRDLDRRLEEAGGKNAPGS